jgi:hypothetical protein
MNIGTVVLGFLILSSLLLSPIAPSYGAEDANRDLGLNTIPQPFNPPGPPVQGPSEFYRSWLIGIRAGLSNPVEYNSVYYYRAPGDLYADFGPYVSASVLYGLARHLMVGLDIDYYSLPFSQDATGIGIGSSQTVSIIPEIEIRSDKLDSMFSMYGSLGLGVTLNSFDRSSALTSVCTANSLGCTAGVDTEALGLRMAIGFDFFFTDTVAFNGELGGIFTTANTKLTLSQTPGVPIYEGSGNLSTVFFLFGLHFLVPH